MNVNIIVPGHGEIQTDWSYVDRQIALFESTGQQVKTAVDGGADLEATHNQVNGDALRKAFGEGSSTSRDEFDYEYLEPAIDAAFKVLRPGPERSHIRAGITVPAPSNRVAVRQCFRISLGFVN